jgi:hypothetical protein
LLSFHAPAVHVTPHLLAFLSLLPVDAEIAPRRFQEVNTKAPCSFPDVLECLIAIFIGDVDELIEPGDRRVHGRIAALTVAGMVRCDPLHKRASDFQIAQCTSADNSEHAQIEA